MIIILILIFLFIKIYSQKLYYVTQSAKIHFHTNIINFIINFIVLGPIKYGKHSFSIKNLKKL